MRPRQTIGVNIPKITDPAARVVATELDKQSAAHEGAIGALQEQRRDAERRLRAAEQKLAETERRLNEYRESGFGENSPVIVELKRQVGEQETRVGHLAGQFEAFRTRTNERLDAAEGRLTSHGERIESLEVTTNRHEAFITSLSGSAKSEPIVMIAAFIGGLVGTVIAIRLFSDNDLFERSTLLWGLCLGFVAVGVALTVLGIMARRNSRPIPAEPAENATVEEPPTEVVVEEEAPASAATTEQPPVRVEARANS